MSQAKYIDDLLRKFNMEDAKTVTTPMDPNQILTTEMCTKNDAERSEIQFNNNPGKLHWQAAKRILRYLKLTRDQGIKFKKTGEPLTAFADTNFASCTSDRRSFTGFVCKHAGGAIWHCQKHQKK
ncbi:hypothetical protein JTE90_025006 [Oedothorax gibbosus]|uniref:Uncharacterized protein n=1 Tax=Oedothorax gibbosus TaxID=931172 RepID=A0AAV6VVU8_9ARAC|nr:hypothetical protein JTE90_025006 [Oedothorax gibbosus]